LRSPLTNICIHRPGDHVVWKAENQKRFAVVQSVDPNQRVATVLFTDTGSQELVSVLELDPTGDSGEVEPHDVLGVRRGDFVFIHSEGATNGTTPPQVPHIGELEAWVREVPIVNGQYSGWRKEFSELGHGVAAERGSGEIFEGAIKRPVKGDSSMYWIGEVTEVYLVQSQVKLVRGSPFNQLNLDGTAQVTHPDMSKQSYPLERLTRLYDGMDQLQDDPWIDTGSDYGDGDYAVDEFGNEVWEDGESWPEGFEASEGHGWNSHEPHLCDCGSYHPHNSVEGEAEPELGPVNEESRDAAQPTAGSPMVTSPIASGDATPVLGTLGDVPVQAQPSSATSGIPKDADEWKRFDTLASAPADHAYYSTVPVQPSRTFMARMSKEYKALMSSLPGRFSVI
jgi:ubiquitin-conjugating enzyme E2 O